MISFDIFRRSNMFSITSKFGQIVIDKFSGIHNYTSWFLIIHLAEYLNDCTHLWLEYSMYTIHNSSFKAFNRRHVKMSIVRLLWLTYKRYLCSTCIWWEFTSNYTWEYPKLIGTWCHFQNYLHTPIDIPHKLTYAVLVETRTWIKFFFEWFIELWIMALKVRSTHTIFASKSLSVVWAHSEYQNSSNSVFQAV